jgi:hypothetical protein
MLKRINLPLVTLIILQMFFFAHSLHFSFEEERTGGCFLHAFAYLNSSKCITYSSTFDFQT